MPLRSELWKGFIFADEVVLKMEYRIGALDLSMGKNRGDYQAIAVVGELQNNYWLIELDSLSDWVSTKGLTPGNYDEEIQYLKNEKGRH